MSCQAEPSAVRLIDIAPAAVADMRPPLLIAEPASSAIALMVIALAA